MTEHFAANLTDFREDNLLPVKIGALNILLFKNEDGSISALEDRCSHADVKLSRGIFENGVIECKAHGARFDCRTGEALCMPAIAPVKSFSVKILDSKIYIVLDH